MKKQVISIDSDKDREKAARTAVLEWSSDIGFVQRAWVWAWFALPKVHGGLYTARDMILFLTKPANKKAYFELLKELGLEKTVHDKNL